MKILARGVRPLATVFFLVEMTACTTDDTVGRRDPSILSLLESQGELAYGDTTPGLLRLSNHVVRAGRRVSAWHFRGVAGSDYAVSLSSADFDSYLYVVGPSIRRIVVSLGGDAYALTDDDSGDGLDAWLCFTALETGPYKVIAGAWEAGTGRYTVAVQELERCPSLAKPLGTEEEEGHSVRSILQRRSPSPRASVSR